jgi:hypothetical protein
MQGLAMQAPIAVDALQEWVIVVYDPMRIDLLHVRLTGPLTPMGQPKATVTLIMSMDSTNVGLPIRVSHPHPDPSSMCVCIQQRDFSWLACSRPLHNQPM